MNGEDGQTDGQKISSRDQLKYICRILGTPNHVDKSFITDDDGIRYLDMLTKNKHKPKLQALFKNVNPLALSLLSEMLQFNPYCRISAKDAIAHPIFDNIRSKHFEKPCRT